MFAIIILGAECPCCGKSVKVDLRATIRTHYTHVNMAEYERHCNWAKKHWDDHYSRPIIKIKPDDDDSPIRTDRAQLCESCARKTIEEIINSLKPHPALSLPLQPQDHLSLAKAKAYLDPAFNLKEYLSSVPTLAELEATMVAASERWEAMCRKKARQRFISGVWETIKCVAYIAFWGGLLFVMILFAFG